MVNQKGGVGKTTTAVNLSAALALSGQQTLLLDMDPQCNATGSLGQTPTNGHALISETHLSENIVETDIENLSILPGSRTFRDVDKLASPTEVESNRIRSH